MEDRMMLKVGDLVLRPVVLDEHFQPKRLEVSFDHAGRGEPYTFAAAPPDKHSYPTKRPSWVARAMGGVICLCKRMIPGNWIGFRVTEIKTKPGSGFQTAWVEPVVGREWDLFAKYDYYPTAVGMPSVSVAKALEPAKPEAVKPPTPKRSASVSARDAKIWAEQSRPVAGSKYGSAHSVARLEPARGAGSRKVVFSSASAISEEMAEKLKAVLPLEKPAEPTSAPEVAVKPTEEVKSVAPREDDLPPFCD